jgi:hypothetical protein
MAQNTASFTIQDYDGEFSKTGVNVGPITVTNFTAKRAAIDDLKNALIDGEIILGELRKTNINESFAESADNVTDVYAQRENKWLVTMRDNTQFLDVANTINNVGFGDTFKIEVPTANANLLQANSDLIDTTDAGVIDWIAALEAIVNSPTGGNECLFVSAQFVGRNL